MSGSTFDRRRFVGKVLGLAATVAGGQAEETRRMAAEPVVDIHQHVGYGGRPDDRLISHQRLMGIRHTVLLPAGSPQSRPSTHGGRSNGLAAGCGGNDEVYRLARENPELFSFGANEVADLPGARGEIERQLRRGARLIAEQKFDVACDGPEVVALAEVAREYGVPVLLHFQHGTYNRGLERFHRVLERFPTVAFIAHAQTWWAHVDEYADPAVLYPTGPVVPGGLSTRLLAEHPNLYGDLSAGSGLNALLRDEGHAAWFLHRFQDQLMYGSDCNDLFGYGPACQGARTLATVRRLVRPGRVRHKLLFANANRVLRLGLHDSPA